MIPEQIQPVNTANVNYWNLVYMSGFFTVGVSKLYNRLDYCVKLFDNIIGRILAGRVVLVGRIAGNTFQMKFGSLPANDFSNENSVVTCNK